MIDWLSVGLNSLWIIGLSVILAAFSYHHWLARETSGRLRDVLSRSSWKVPFSAGMMLTGVGFGWGLAARWWQRAIWTALALTYAYRLVADLREERTEADS
jgi:dipeptide/tripeptide permease